MQRFWSVLALFLASVGTSLAQDGDATKTDMFFAGTVVETTAEKITVSRVVRGRAQKHSFAVTPDTKVDGKLRTRVRVTVRYVSDDDGDTAIRIVVRAATPKPKP